MPQAGFISRCLLGDKGEAFTSACDSYLSASTYHNELVSLPLYDTVNYWQYNAAEDFDYKSGVVVIPSSEEGELNPTTQTVGNVVGVLLDRMAVGTTITERWSATDRFNSERRTNTTFGCNIGYFNDLSENGLVLTLNQLFTFPCYLHRLTCLAVKYKKPLF